MYIVKLLVLLISPLFLSFLTADDPASASEPIQDSKSFLQQGALDAAISAYTEAIRLDPKSADAYYGRARAHLKNREIEEAIADYTAAIRLAPKSARVYYGRAMAYQEKGEMERAIDDMRSVVGLKPKSGDAHYALAYLYRQSGDIDGAARECDELIRLEPNNARGYYGKGTIFQENGNFDLAIASYGKVIQLEPKGFEAYFSRGRVYAAKADFDKAEADFDQAVKLRPDYPCFYEVRGSAKIRRGDYDGGIADLQTAVRLNPSDPAMQFEARSKASLPADAIQRGEEQVRKMLSDRAAMALFGEKARPLYAWAARKFAGEDARQEIVWDASEPFFASESLPPTGETPWRLRIAARYSDGPNKGHDQSFEDMWSKAVFELYNISNAECFRQIELQVSLGKLTKDEFARKMTEGESRAAEKTRAFCIRVFLPWAKEQHLTTNPELWFVAWRSDPGKLLLPPLPNERVRQRYDLIYDGQMLLSLAAKGESEKVIELAAKIEKQPMTSEAVAALRSARGEAYRREGKFNAAIADFSEVIRLFPKGGWAYWNRGYAYAKSGDLDKAIADYTAAIRMSPDDSKAYELRGEAYAKKGMRAEADSDVDRAKRLNESKDGGNPHGD